MLRTDPNLAGISHVIIDEVHERELKTDVVLALLKLMKRTDLKVIDLSILFKFRLIFQDENVLKV